ncbi:MAG: DNA primase [Polyangia bacterium]
MGLIPHSKVAEIRDRTDIVAVIGEHVQLRRAGVNYLGLCPFHQEKSPSFNVSAAKQFFYCFGCQKSGDVIRFLMEREGRSFADVVRDLAARAGIDIPEDEEESRPERKALRLQQESERLRLLKLNALASKYYQAQLAASERALQYVASRGISDEIRTGFRLGYAPDSWDGLLQVLRQRGVPHELAELGGLLIRREGSTPLPKGAPPTTQTHYDRFRDRVLCPLLLPKTGQQADYDVIAFSGRVLPTEQPRPNEGAKYINSPETPLYRKGQNLYGLHVGRDEIRKRRQVVLVEGNFDVLSLHQHGFPNTLAPMGTALTETQVRLLSRLIGEDGHVVLMLDGDRAGRAATMKDISLLMLTASQMADVAALSQRDIDVRVAKLPDGEDPDTLAHRDAAALERCIAKAQPALDYVIDEVLATAESDSLSGRAKVIGRIAPLLAALRSETLRELYVGRVTSALAVDPKVLWRQMEQSAGTMPSTAHAAASSRGEHAVPSMTASRSVDPRGSAVRGSAPSAFPRASASAQRPQSSQASPMDMQGLEAGLRNLLGLLADKPALWDRLSDETIKAVAHPMLAELLEEARDLCHSGEIVSVETFVNMCPVELRAQVASAMLVGRFTAAEHPDELLSRMSAELRAQAIVREVNDLQRTLSRISRTGEQENRLQILSRIQDLTKLRASLLQNSHPGTPAVAGTAQGDTPR